MEYYWYHVFFAGKISNIENVYWLNDSVTFLELQYIKKKKKLNKKNYPSRKENVSKFHQDILFLVYCFICRSSCSQMFFKMGVLRNLTIFTGKHLHLSLTNKVAGLKEKRDSNTGLFL